MNPVRTEWHAHWIWGGTEESPRNQWRCFRRTFEVPVEGWNEGTLSISADSRYVLYVNGEQVGRGPSRSWPSEQSYDTYEVGHLLRPGQPNTIAVLVQHFGVSTFYYIRGRGGLLCQLELTGESGNSFRLGTDESWLTSRYLGQDERAPRMSCQHAFTEKVDAREWDSGWNQPHYEDSHWEQAAVIGEVGMKPWETLAPRSIPQLTEESVHPSRIESLSRVVPVPWSGCIDLRNQMIPGSESDANAYRYAGYAGTSIRVREACEAVIVFSYTPPHFQGMVLNGKRYEKTDFEASLSEKWVRVALKEGDNLLLLAVAGDDHGRGIFMGLDCPVPFELVSPLGDPEPGLSPFFSIGPMVSYEYIDHRYSQEDRRKQALITACGRNELPGPEYGEEGSRLVSAYLAAGQAASLEELSAFREWVRPVPEAFVSQESLRTLCSWKKEEERMPVPAQLQSIVAAHSVPGVIPVYETGDTEFIVDFGRQLSGYVTFEVEAEAGTVLDLYGFEHMRDGWIQHTYYLENTLRYICREGRQRYTSPIRRGLRYLMVTVRGAGKPVRCYGIRMELSHFPAPEIGKFHSSDSTLNEIWRISRHTTKLCMEDTFVDCPAYEQTFWVGDSRNEALVAYYLFGAEDIVKRCLELVPGSRDQSPLYADQVPSGWSSVIPNWTFFWVNACVEYYERTGDLGFAASIYPHAAYTLDHYLMKREEHGLLSLDAWNFLDWAPIDQPREGIVTHQNMFLVKALQGGAQLAFLAGDTAKEEEYTTAARNLAESINTHLWSEEKQAYLDCIHADGRQSAIFSMQSQVVALLCGIPEGDRKTKLERMLLTPPEDFVPIGSPFMSFFYYEALVQAGLYTTMIEDIRKQYGEMLEYEATTCWEMYPKKKNGRTNEHNLTRSHCHAWSAAPGYFLGAVVLGVRSAAPGWRKVIVEPNPCGLTWARGSVPLPEEGRVDVSWKAGADGKLHLQVWVPETVDVEVRLPDGVEGTMDVHRQSRRP